MNNTFGQFNKKAIHTFSEEMAERFDFTRCQRPDGTYYGTGGQCRKGAQVGPKEIAALKKAAAGGNDRAQQALDKIEGKDSKPAVKEEAPKGAPPAADKMSQDDLRAVPVGSEVSLADGDVYRKQDDGNFYRIKEDGSLSTLDYKPHELRQNAIGAAARAKEKEDASVKTKSESDAKAAKSEGDEAPKKGALAPDKNDWKDTAKLEADAQNWRDRNDLGGEEAGHDLIHVGTHSFIGRTSEDLARMQGTKGVTTTEEILINFISNHAMAGGGPIDSRASLLADAKEMKDFFQQGGVDSLTPTQERRWNRDSRRAAAIFEQMSKRPDFDEFISRMEQYT